MEIYNKWISVKDHLPEEGVYVFVCTEFDCKGDWRYSVGALQPDMEPLNRWWIKGASWEPSYWMYVYPPEVSND